MEIKTKFNVGDNVATLQMPDLKVVTFEVACVEIVFKKGTKEIVYYPYNEDGMTDYFRKYSEDALYASRDEIVEKVTRPF